MASSVLRTRIALLALIVALAFVVVGFLRADREMTQGEKDRASLVASETATLVEVFVLRRITQLHAISRVVDGHVPDHIWRADIVSSLTPQVSQVAGLFDQVWVISAGRQNADSALLLQNRHGVSRAPLHLDNRYSLPADRTPVVIASAQSGKRVLLFTESVHDLPNIRLVGVVISDSLAVLLQRQKRSNTAGVVVTAGVDTVVAMLPAMPNKSRRTLRQVVDTPGAKDWAITMTYVPTGRGARIALWVVGLGAIVGLGIGLLLERREASRIADRSSELEHLSTELLRANRAKSEFLANVSHELRTPLNAIVGFVDLLRDGVYGPLNARQSGPVERIEASANHLRHLVDQVLDLAKMAAGRLEVHTEPIELRPFVFDVASEVEPLMTEKGLSFSLAVGASLPRVRTDPTHLRQILINLLGNAVKFTNSGGISVRGKLVKHNSHVGGTAARLAATDLLGSAFKVETPWIALQVADSGIGIPEKDRERIFDEFEQVNAGPRGDSMRRGTGLGLSISRRLARLLGGDITVESELGRGSVFTVWLPVDPADLRGDQAA